MDVVSDLMTPDPILVRADAPLAECARILAVSDKRHLLVIDGDGALYGVVRDHDVFSLATQAASGSSLWVARDGTTPKTAGDLAKAPGQVARPDDPVLMALQRALRQLDECIVVVDSDAHPVGIVTEQDLVRLARDVLPPTLLAAREASAPVRTIGSDRSAREAWAVMLAYQIRHLVVQDDGRATGVVSWSDLMAADVAARDALVGKVVPPRALQSLAPDATLREAAERMATLRIGALPILDEDGGVEAIVTRRDVARALLAALEDEALFSE